MEDLKELKELKEKYNGKFIKNDNILYLMNGNMMYSIEYVGYWRYCLKYGTIVINNLSIEDVEEMINFVT